MKDIIKVLEARLEDKLTDLEESQFQFAVMVANELNTSCFERNAITELQGVVELKAEIQELSHVLDMLKVNEMNKDTEGRDEADGR